MSNTITLRANAVSRRLADDGWMRARAKGDGLYSEGFLVAQITAKYAVVQYLHAAGMMRRRIVMREMAADLRKHGYAVKVVNDHHLEVRVR